MTDPKTSEAPSKIKTVVAGVAPNTGNWVAIVAAGLAAYFEEAGRDIKPANVLAVVAAVGLVLQPMVRVTKTHIIPTMKRNKIWPFVLGAVMLASVPAFAQDTTVTATKTADGDTYVLIEKDVARVYLDGAEEVYLSFSAGFDVFSINLRTKDYELGAVPGIGYGLKWSPEFWTLTPVLLSLDLYARGGIVEADGGFAGPDFFASTLLGIVTVADWIGVGIGPEWKLSLHRGLKSRVDPILTLGIRKSF